MIRPWYSVSLPIRSKVRSSWAMPCALPRSDGVQQRERDIEHALERRDAHALGWLVVALGAVGQADGGQAGDLEGVGVGAAAGRDRAGPVAAGVQRPLGGEHGRRARLVAVAIEEALDADVEVGLAQRLVGGIVA